MTTSIGIKENTLDELLEDLIQLDYDAIAAYEAAIERLDDPGFKAKLGEFCEDHRRHTQNLSAYMRRMGETPPEGGDVKMLLAKGKVVLANLGGDDAILKAMKTNEADTNTAYDRARNHKSVTPEIRTTIEENYADERRHIEWIRMTLASLERRAA